MTERELNQPERMEISRLDKLLAQLLAVYGKAEAVSINSVPDYQGIASRLVIRQQLLSRRPSSLIYLQIVTDYFPGYFPQTLEEMTPEERLQVIADREVFLSVASEKGKARTLLLKTKRKVTDPEVTEEKHFSLLAGLKDSSAPKTRALILTEDELQKFERLVLDLAHQLATSQSNGKNTL